MFENNSRLQETGLRVDARIAASLFLSSFWLRNPGKLEMGSEYYRISSQTIHQLRKEEESEK